MSCSSIINQEPVFKNAVEASIYRLKKKSLVKQFRSDSLDTYLSHVDQQKAMLLDTIDDAKPKKINKYVEPEIDENINRIAESRLRYETLRKKRKPPEIFEKNNSNVNSGLAGILAVSKRIKD